MERMTEKKTLNNYNPYESIPVISIADYPGERGLVVVTEYDWYDRGVDGRKIRHTSGQYMTGPIVDRLWEYENLGMEPSQITSLIDAKTDMISKVSTELRERNEEVKRLRKRIEGLLEHQSSRPAESEKLMAETQFLRKENETLRNRIGRYESIIQTIELIFGGNIDV